MEFDSKTEKIKAIARAKLVKAKAVKTGEAAKKFMIKD